EKILSGDEQLPEDWPVHGTTGYDYLIYQNGLFIQRDHEAAFTGIHSRFTGSTEDFESLAYRSKQDVLNHMFIAEVNSLTACIKRVVAGSRYGRDFTEADLRTAIIDFIAGFPVYRTYVTTESNNLSPAESAYIQRGLAEARQHTKAADFRALEFLARVLSLDFPADFDDELRSEAREFVVRFQQLSGPATAKGLEDTAFYRHTRFVSLNEVGGNPGRFGISPEEFHEYNSHKQQQWPHSMLATSTHDTKRGEDTRARLNVLSEMPADWEQKVFEWRALNESFKRNHSPAFSDEYLLYQILLGTWIPDPDLPAYIERLQNYMLKASREAKTNTSWTEPNEPYESATKTFVADILNSASFRQSLASFASEIAYFGTFNSIAQVILKTCSPGVPDFYQGTEHWDLTLVDPDNRRPIDYSLRKKLLAELETTRPSDLLNNWESGAIKLFTTATTLRIRRENPALTSGDYRAISISGARSKHIVSFARTSGNSNLLIAVPRFIRTLTAGEQIYPHAAHWADTRLDFEGARFKNLLTGEEHHTLAAADLFKTFPAAILVPLD
ncbi:MAG: malto-oligosyltrehalose synthase, partial [Limisphaerales bacterium]